MNAPQATDQARQIDATGIGLTRESTRVKKKVCWIVTKDITVLTFLVPLLKVLGDRFDLSLIVDTQSANVLRTQIGSPIKVYPVRIERAPAVAADLFTLLRINRILKRERFDFVHTVTPKAGLLGMLAARYCRVPVRIHTFQGEVWASRSGLSRRALKALDRLLALCATNILVVSESGRRFLAEQHVVPFSKTQVIGNGSICGVDLARFKPNQALRIQVRGELAAAPDNTVFLFVGRLNRDKGVPELLAAFESLVRMRPNVRLWLVGPDEQNMRSQIETLATATRNRMWLCDFRTDPETVMAAADVLVLPSHREGFGMTVIEAAACGVPAIVSNIHGLSDTCIADSTALTHIKGSSESLRDCMLKFAANADLRARFGRAARERVRYEFSQQRVVAGLLQYYENLGNLGQHFGEIGEPK